MSTLSIPNPAAESQGQSQWFPQLDGIRAVALTLVCIHHWTVKGQVVGSVGVQLFFVLSGFLITGILLRERLEVEAGRQSISFSAKQFYIRRFLRIFPLFYFCLASCLILGRFGIRKTFPWHFFYLSNFLFFSQDHFDFPFAHFWSLAVEEQFYLFWPGIVLLVPRRLLPTLLLVLIALAPLSRLAVLLSGRPDFVQTTTMVWANFDSLGIGALIALLRLASEERRALFMRYLTWALPFCAAELLISYTLSSVFLATTVDLVAVALLSAWVVWNASTGFSGIAGKFLSNPVISYLGRISYGLYVWHMFAPVFVQYILRALGLPMTVANGAMGFALFFMWTTVAATLTWLLFEKPINQLKRYFPYRKKTSSTTGLAVD